MNRNLIFGAAVTGTLCVALILLGASGVSAGRQRQPTTQNDATMALREGGLHAAAKAAGGFYNRVMAGSPDIVVPDLVTLARASEDVIAIEVLSNESHLSADGTYITTDYRVRVDDVLQGSLQKRDEVILSVLGGRVEFGDGTAAQVSTMQFQKPVDGEKLIVFGRRMKPELVSASLRTFAGNATIVNPARGGLGIFGLPDDDLTPVKPKGRSTDPVSRENRKKPKGDFVRDVKDAVKEARKLGPASGADFKAKLQ